MIACTSCIGQLNNTVYRYISNTLFCNAQNASSPINACHSFNDQSAIYSFCDTTFAHLVNLPKLHRVLLLVYPKMAVPCLSVIRRIENAGFQMLNFLATSPGGCTITTAEHPGHSSPFATVNSLDDPKPAFFELIK